MKTFTLIIMLYSDLSTGVTENQSYVVARGLTRDECSAIVRDGVEATEINLTNKLYAYLCEVEQ